MLAFSLIIDHLLMQILQTYVQFGATKVSERLRMFVSGSSSDVEIQPHDFWDIEIGNDVWSF